jgi:hypothetical protein
MKELDSDRYSFITIVHHSIALHSCFFWVVVLGPGMIPGFFVFRHGILAITSKESLA